MSEPDKTVEDSRWRQVTILPGGKKLNPKVPKGWGSRLRLQKPSTAQELGEPGTSKGQGAADGWRTDKLDNGQLGPAPFSSISWGALSLVAHISDIRWTS